MPKAKTRKSVSSRFKVTGTGKLIYRKKNKNHILTKKTSKRKRQLGKDGVLSAVETKRHKKMMLIK